jgi:hypothetical protein
MPGMSVSISLKVMSAVEREAELLRVGYFHLVFTLPGANRRNRLTEQSPIYGLLFTAAAEVTLTIAADPKRLGDKIVHW